eukprot:1161210-Pelagomonas_calceolata.AAC.2
MATLPMSAQRGSPYTWLILTHGSSCTQAHLTQGSSGHMAHLTQCSSYIYHAFPAKATWHMLLRPCAGWAPFGLRVSTCACHARWVGAFRLQVQVLSSHDRTMLLQQLTPPPPRT